MYYEEKVINGVLSFRTFPGAPFVPMSPEKLTARIQELEQKISAAKESESLYEKAPWWTNPNIPPMKPTY